MRVTAKCQTTLPRDAKEVLGLKAVDTVRYIVGRSSVSTLKARQVRKLFGKLC